MRRFVNQSRVQKSCQNKRDNFRLKLSVIKEVLRLRWQKRVAKRREKNASWLHPESIRCQGTLWEGFCVSGSLGQGMCLRAGVGFGAKSGSVPTRTCGRLVKETQGMWKE